MIVVEIEYVRNPKYRVFRMPEVISRSPMSIEVFIRPAPRGEEKTFDSVRYLDIRYLEDENIRKLNRIGPKGAAIVTALTSGEPSVNEIFVGEDWFGVAVADSIFWKDVAASIKVVLVRTFQGTVSFSHAAPPGPTTVT